MIKWEKSWLVNELVEHYDIQNQRWVIVLYPNKIKNGHIEIQNKYFGVVMDKVCGSTKIYEENYEVLKLKCIIKARELGWKI